MGKYFKAALLLLVFGFVFIALIYFGRRFFQHKNDQSDLQEDIVAEPTKKVKRPPYGYYWNNLEGLVITGQTSEDFKSGRQIKLTTRDKEKGLVSVIAFFNPTSDQVLVLRRPNWQPQSTEKWQAVELQSLQEILNAGTDLQLHIDIDMSEVDNLTEGQVVGPITRIVLPI